MKKPIVTEIIDVSAQKRALRVNAAKLVITRADNELRIAPNARASVILRDMRLALKELIEELEFKP